MLMTSPDITPNNVVEVIIHYFSHSYYQPCPPHQMRTRFYKAAAKPKKRTQGVARQHKRIRLAKEARAAIIARQRAASKRYHEDLRTVWGKMDDEVATIATAHHKSVRRVQRELHMGRSIAHTKQRKTSAWSAFCWKKQQSLKANQENGAFSFNPVFVLIHIWSTAGDVQGKEVLPDLVRSHREEYNTLPLEERNKLVQELDEHKANRVQGL
jgi:hypothetical protein